MADWLQKMVSSAVNAVAGTGPVSADLQVSEEERLELAAAGHLTLGTPRGSISITGTDESHASLTYTKRSWGLSQEEAQRAFDEVKVVVQLEGLTTRVTTETPRRGRASRVEVSYQIAVPADVAVTVESASGSIQVCDMAAHIVASTASGSIVASGCSEGLHLTSASGLVSVSKCSGTIELTAQSGGVEAAECIGSLTVNSKSGAVTVRGGTGAIDIRSVSGAILVDPVFESSAFKATCVSGSISAEVSPEPGTDVYAKSVSGEVTLALPEGVFATIDCRTGSGEVRVALPCILISSNPRRVVATCGTHEGRPVRVKAEARSGNVNLGVMP